MAYLVRICDRIMKSAFRRSRKDIYLSVRDKDIVSCPFLLASVGTSK